MNRDLNLLAEKRFDILVVGGGVYGAAIVREAATRGLRAALIEQNDFCSGTSANSLKILHGGLRYLQQADLPRVIESISERSTWLRTAPHLVEPLDCIMPTRPTLLRSRPVMSLGLWINDLLSAGRNRGLDRAREIRAARTVDKAACLGELPHLVDSAKVTGGAIWHDGLGFDTERLVIAMLLDAADADACVANYVRASELIVQDGAVDGVYAQDRMTGADLTIRADVVINAAGPWAAEFLQGGDLDLTVPCRHLALGINLVLRRGPSLKMAAGLTAGPGTSSGGRLFFFVPWRGAVMAGTYYRAHSGRVDAAAPTEDDIDACLAALNSCYRGMDLTREDILRVQAGVIPAARAAKAGTEPALLRHYRLIDHGNADGVERLLTVLGVKYTTARRVAQHVVSAAASRLNCPLVPSSTSVRPLPGGVIGNLAAYCEETMATYGSRTPPAVVERLLRYYGSEVDAILSDRESARLLEGSDRVLDLEIRHVIANEMPQTLGDLIFRRTGLGTRTCPAAALVRACGRMMADTHGWSHDRLEREIEAVMNTTCLWRAATHDQVRRALDDTSCALFG